MICNQQRISATLSAPFSGVLGSVVSGLADKAFDVPGIVHINPLIRTALPTPPGCLLNSSRYNLVT